MSRRIALAVLLLAGFVIGCATRRPKLALVTTAERTNWIETGRYDEAIALCRDFARAHAGVRCEEIGRTLQDRPIVAVRIARAPGRPTIYLQAGVHAGEIEGKDAGFWFLRDLLAGKVATGALAAVNVVFVPCINPDGHERFGPNNRPNQRGPAQMGFRTNGARMNINRDFMKADTPEIAAVLEVYRRHDPLVLVDLHATDGAKFEHDIAVLVSPAAPRGDSLDDVARALSAQLQERLTALGHLPLPFYPSFEIDDDPQSGFSIGEAPPRFSQAYAGVRSRLGILVETHSWRTYEERARSTYHLLQALFERATADAPAWQAAADAAARADRRLPGRDLTVVWKNGPRVTELAFRGYAYERRASEISGGTWIVFDERTPEVWRVPLREEIVAGVTVRVPGAGYVIDGGFAALIAPLLDRHGVSYTRIDREAPLDLEVFRASAVAFEPPYEGRTRVSVQGSWSRETRTLDRGALFVPIDQPRPRLVVHLLDPAAPDSVVQWGLTTTAFERKEYMEAYVAEEIARELLARDPGLQRELDSALAADPALATSPARRLDWFYRRHPAWDERVNLVPIYRSDRAPTAP